ncbi:MAG: Gfo/Idh/MocA family oxidoreductase [Lentisphaerae bacterium]|nr:Gfo/Idh/MocA family oxidoreductase [Lentisphaerota bacterium]
MIKFALIGAGRLGKVHAGSINLLENCTLTTVYDPDPAAAEFMRQQYNARIAASASEAVNAPDVDAVIIASPTYCHIEGLRLALQAHKPILCEKPLTRHLTDAQDVRRAIQTAPQPLAVGFVRRHMLKTRMAKEIIDSGKLGRIKFCNIELPFGAYKRLYGDWFTDFEKSGGVITDMLAHHVDLANWFFGAPQRVYAQSMLLDNTQQLPSDYVSSTVTYANGVIVNFMCSWQRFGRSGELMEIYGENGSLSLDGDQAVKLAMLNCAPEVLDATEIAQSSGVNNASTGNGFVNELMNFTAWLDGRKPDFMPDAEAGFASLQVADAMIRSARTHQVIEL